MSYDAQWSGPFEGYVVNYLQKNHWKIARTVPHEDALQEAAVVFLRCRRRYKVDEGAHFMALFKTAWHRRFLDLANKDTIDRQATYYGADDLQRDQPGDDIVGEVDNEGYLRALVRQAPREVQMVCSLMLNAPQELLEVALAGWHAGGDLRSTSGGSDVVNRLLGLPEKVDTLQQVRDYFST